MKKKRAQQSAWRRHIDSDITLASLVRRRARTAEARLALARNVSVATVSADPICPTPDSNTQA